jgi:hypothetical protein
VTDIAPRTLARREAYHETEPINTYLQETMSDLLGC